MGVSKAACAWIAFGAFTLGAMGGCGVGCSFGSYSARNPTAAESRIPNSRLAPPPSPLGVPGAQCTGAPESVVALINAAFIDGEHLENAQALSGPKALTYVGGDIYSASGQRVSSRDTWVHSGGVVYAISSDARRRTMLPDGRKLDGAFNWPDYSYELSACVGRADDATPGR